MIGRLLPSRLSPFFVAGLILTAVFALRLSVGISAHDNPVKVLVQSFVKPEGQRLRVLVRVPMSAMRDFPVTGADNTMLDLAKVDAAQAGIFEKWIKTDFRFAEDGKSVSGPAMIAARVAPASDTSFATYDKALAHFSEPPLAADTKLPLATAHFDVLMEYPIVSDRSRFDLDLHLSRLGSPVVTTVRFLMPDRAERLFQFTNNPGVVQLDPSWSQAAWRFVESGFRHILDGIDHLLFLICLVLPLRRIWELVKVVTAFTVAHSITLFCSAFGLVPSEPWFPPLIEALIAVSIVYMAFENIVLVVRARRSAGNGAERMDSAPSAILQRRWIITFGFGLIHGFGFSFALKETMQLAGSHLVTSLLSFNIGVELGQMLVLALTLPVLALLFRFVVEEQLGVILASAAVANTAWDWLVERTIALRRFAWYLRTPETIALLLKVLAVVVIVGAVAWLAKARVRRRVRA